MAASSNATAHSGGDGIVSAPPSRFTRLSKIVCSLLILGYVVGCFLPRTADYFALVPGRILPCVWNVFTCAYFEQRAVSLLLNCAALLVLGSVLEPIWGSKEFLKFLVLINLVVGCGSFVICLIAYFATYSENMLYGKFSGFQGAIGGLLVGIKQAMPDQEIVLVKVVNIRVKHFPLLFVLASVAGHFFGLPDEIMMFIVLGTFSSWIYLRFFQAHPQARLQGDPSEHFSFAGFFPEPIQPAIELITVPLSKLFRTHRRNVQNTYALGGQPLPGSAPIDASRRRERGAKALEERLAAGGSAQTSMEYPEENGEDNPTEEVAESV